MLINRMHVIEVCKSQVLSADKLMINMKDLSFIVVKISSVCSKNSYLQKQNVNNSKINIISVEPIANHNMSN